MIKANLSGNQVSSNDKDAFSLYEKSRFGEKVSGKIRYSTSEAIYLVEKGKIEILQKNKKLSAQDIIKKFQRKDKKIQTKYPVFRDLRNKGYIVKTALKFGAELRVYDKGKKPGQTHAKWIVFTESETSKLDWHEFSAKNRVAHSTKKKLLLAIVDEEGDISYYEVGWTRP